MTKNLIIKSAIAIAIPALISIAPPLRAECTSCNDLALSTSKVTPAKNNELPSNLVKLSSGNGYLLSKTTTDNPFITEQSYQFIEELAKVYLEKCRDKKIGEWPFVITSVNKINESVDNVPLNGTAIKISWVRFGKEELQSQAHLNTLIEALMEMRDKETCYVKFEGKQACFRILVNESKIDGLNAVAKR